MTERENGRQRIVGPTGPLATSVRWATTPTARLRGVLGRPLGPEEALVIQPCRRVHTFGIAYPLEVVFCAIDAMGGEGSFIVLHVETLRPRKVSRRVGGARLCIEVRGGRVAAGGVVAGVRLRIEAPA